jgi:hypothetical protein
VSASISLFRVPGARLRDPQCAQCVINRVPDPTSAGYFVLPLLKLNVVDLDGLQIELELMLPIQVVAAPRISGNGNPGAVKVLRYLSQ